MARRYYLTHISLTFVFASTSIQVFPLFFGSINAKYFAFFLGKIYLSISRVALILLAFLSHSRYVVCSVRIEGDGL
jgi:hypothetical protein